MLIFHSSDDSTGYFEGSNMKLTFLFHNGTEDFWIISEKHVHMKMVIEIIPFV